jgi:hypothetical protein
MLVRWSVRPSVGWLVGPHITSKTDYVAIPSRLGIRWSPCLILSHRRRFINNSTTMAPQPFILFSALLFWLLRMILSTMLKTERTPTKVQPLWPRGLTGAPSTEPTGSAENTVNTVNTLSVDSAGSAQNFLTTLSPHVAKLFKVRSWEIPFLHFWKSQVVLKDGDLKSLSGKMRSSNLDFWTYLKAWIIDHKLPTHNKEDGNIGSLLTVLFPRKHI